ncbi:hypothetical protein Ancab_003423 [Ancistrocladus abbreviatus]
MENRDDSFHFSSVSNETLEPSTTIHPKHQAMLDRLSKNNQSRLQNRELGSNSSSPAFESTNSFLSRFSDLKQSITSELTRIEQSPDSLSSKPDLDPISSSIADLEKLLAENSYYLPPYEVRASLKTISDLKDSLDNLSSQLFPRKKFSFKNKPIKPKNRLENLVNVMEKQETERPDSISSSDKLADLIGRDFLGFRNREGEILVEDFKGKDVGEFMIADLCSCHVKLKGRSRQVFIHRLKNCKVYAGPALGSILIEDVEGCLFILASHQIRIHNAKKCDFYLRVRSRPIIEDSIEVRFAPYCLEYEGIEEDLKESRLNEETGNWENVDDFKWLRAVHSPNWSVLPVSDRIGAILI